MDNNLLEFSKKLEETKKNDEYNKYIWSKDGYSAMLGGLLPTHNFYIAYRTNYHCLMISNPIIPIITLDEEDVKYLSDKYLSKLQDEMNSRINKIKEQYGQS